MSTKRLVLEVLEKNRGNSISGEEIAGALHLSRNMIWRAIRELREEGYQIEAVTKRGYRLTGENDILSAEGIKPFLLFADAAENIYVYPTMDSTNREAKAQAVNRAVHGTVILSDGQTGGRGRQGRAFFSPPGSGLYLSIVLRAEEMNFSSPTDITFHAAVCVCEAVESLYGLKLAIKWVNDLFLEGKKVGGILTEAITDLESRSLSEIILGIGLNVCTRQEDFPEELRETAGSLYPEGGAPVTRNRLAAEILNRVLFSGTGEGKELFRRYKERLFILGQRIIVKQGRDQYEATALNITEKGSLIVQTPDGKKQTLSSGEVSISPTFVDRKNELSPIF